MIIRKRISCATMNVIVTCHSDIEGKDFFFKFPNLFAICNDTFSYTQQMVWWVARAGRGSAL
jgi:hypothetical protein